MDMGSISMGLHDLEIRLFIKVKAMLYKCYLIYVCFRIKRIYCSYSYFIRSLKNSLISQTIEAKIIAKILKEKYQIGKLI